MSSGFLFQGSCVQGVANCTSEALEREVSNLSDVDAIVFSKLDRLARSSLYFYELLQKAGDEDVVLVSAAEARDCSTPNGRRLTGIPALFAELESATISARVKSSQEWLALQGYVVAGNVPRGWTAEMTQDGHRRMVLDPDGAETMTAAVESFLGDGNLAKPLGPSG